MTITIRCSALPRVWACPASEAEAAPGDVLINESSEPAECGTATHRWLSAYIKDGTELSKADLAKEHGCDVDELSMLCAMGIKVLNQIKEKLGPAAATLRTEIPLRAVLAEGIEIVGSADLGGEDGDWVVFIDFKTGRVDSDYGHQLKGYGLCGIRRRPGSAGAIVVTAWLREGYWDIERMTRDQLESWADEMARRIRNGRDQFSPGAVCGYCRRRMSCPARRVMVQSVVSDLTVGGAPIIEWTPETRTELGPQIGEMFGKMRVIEKAAQAFRDLVKVDVEQFGPLKIGGGRQLATLEVRKRVVDPAKARAVFGEVGLTQEEIDGATTISASKLDDAVAAKAPKGGGAAAKRALAAALEAGEAVRFDTSLQLREGKES